METNWQVFFIDGLFLLLAAGIGLWFKAWLREQHEIIDQRLRVLEVHQKTLELLSARLQSACLMLEQLVEAQQPAETQPGRAGRAARTERDNYQQARTLLGQGLSPSEVARRLGLGLAEVETLGRMMRRGE
ncbi:MAG: hypothetical protein HYW07_22905 [Candidatus Latescibacteria bacterium]|nr:hypothetical protein [Candidatus Latescibacterota bacterium]